MTEPELAHLIELLEEAVGVYAAADWPADEVEAAIELLKRETVGATCVICGRNHGTERY